jgi:hypothetical protein
MSFLQVALTHAIADQAHKPPFFFSRFNFTRMKERGNTHYCFHCGGNVGFTPGPNGEAMNSIHDSSGYNPMAKHDSIAHQDAVIGGADKYDWVGDWLRAKIKSDFPYVVTVPSL